jgi:hypothetical protein
MFLYGYPNKIFINCEVNIKNKLFICGSTLFFIISAVLTFYCARLTNDKNLLLSQLENVETELYDKKIETDILEEELFSLKSDNSSLKNRLNRLQEDLPPLDVELENALAAGGTSTSDMVDIYCSYGDKWKDEMNRYLDLLTEKLKDDKKHFVALSQEKWSDFIKDNEELQWQTYDQIHHAGSLMYTYTAKCYLESYRSRALFLKNLYDFLTIDGYY